MAVVEEKSATDAKVWSLCRMPFWHSGNGSTSSSAQLTQNHQQQVLGTNQQQMTSVSTVARSLLPARRRLRLDPASKLYFPYEPGKQVRSAVRIKNTSKSHVAFKGSQLNELSRGNQWVLPMSCLSELISKCAYLNEFYNLPKVKVFSANCGKIQTQQLALKGPEGLDVVTPVPRLMEWSYLTLIN